MNKPKNIVTHRNGNNSTEMMFGIILSGTVLLLQGPYCVSASRPRDTVEAFEEMVFTLSPPFLCFWLLSSTMLGGITQHGNTWVCNHLQLLVLTVTLQAKTFINERSCTLQPAVKQVYTCLKKKNTYQLSIIWPNYLGDYSEFDSDAGHNTNN